MVNRILAAVSLAMISLGACATDYSDIWWNPAESGWGINLAQSDKFIFATFFVYGPGNVPTWYAGNLTLDSSGNYTGGLYTTTGTYLGIMPYDPAQFGVTSVGTASFRPTAPDSGLLTYTVGSVPVTKNIQRQTLTAIPLAGTYASGAAGMVSGCSDPANNKPFAGSAQVTVTQSTPGQMQVTIGAPDAASCTFASSGPVTQNGQLYSFSGRYTCTTTSASTTVTVSELKATSLGIEGRWTAPMGAGCREDGRFSGVLY